VIYLPLQELIMTGKSKLLSRVLICAPLAMLGALFLHAQTDLNGYWVFKVPRGDGTFTESYFELKQSEARRRSPKARSATASCNSRWR
jgi:hypothetical protein